MTTAEPLFKRGILGMSEAARLAQCSVTRFRSLARTGRLPFRAVVGGHWGRYWLVDQGSLEDWLRARPALPGDEQERHRG